jgi:hypothetical protein
LTAGGVIGSNEVNFDRGELFIDLFEGNVNQEPNVINIDLLMLLISDLKLFVRVDGFTS